MRVLEGGSPEIERDRSIVPGQSGRQLSRAPRQVCVVRVGLQPHARATSAGTTIGRAGAKSAGRRRHTPDGGIAGWREPQWPSAMAGVVLVARSGLTRTHRSRFRS